MYGVLLPGNRRVLIKEFPDPEPKSDEVVVKIRAAQICGSDLSLYHGWALVGEVPPGTVIAGHHQTGIVEKVGGEVRHLKEGDRVAAWVFIGCGHCKYCRSGWYQLCSEVRFLGFNVNGGFAEFLAVPARSCLKLPEKMSFVSGAFAEALGTLYNAAKTLGVSGDNTVIITGIGPMGATGLIICKALGAKVFCVDPSEDRLLLAKSLGANEVIDPTKGDPVNAIRSLTDGEGADVGIECSGKQDGLNTTLDSARKLGKVAIVGECLEAKIKPSAQFLRKRLTVFGVWNFNINEWDRLAKFVIDKGIDMKKTVTHKLPLLEADEGFRLFEEKKAIVVFTP